MTIVKDTIAVHAPADLLAEHSAATPARIFVGRAGSSYRTPTLLSLREDHAAARDAVMREFDLVADLGQEFSERWHLFGTQTQARTRLEYLMRPDLGRVLDEQARLLVQQSCPRAKDVQIIVGDGLSPTAVAAQVPALLPLLAQACTEAGLSLGRSFFVRNCRVGVLNDVGTLLDPSVVILLIGERPGLATAESLSAYIGYRPRAQHTDAQRNLISNIHAQGILPADAARRIVNLVLQMRQEQSSGVTIKEREDILAIDNSI